MSHTLAQLAEILDGQISGDPATTITGADIIRDAVEGHITFASDAKLAAELGQSSASAVIVAEDFPATTMPAIIVANPTAAFAQVVALLRPLHSHANVDVSRTANICVTAQLGEDVQVHPGATIAADVTIDRGTVIHAGVHIMAGCQIGANVQIYPGCVLYENTVIGDRVILHANVVAGSFGFGYDFADGAHQLSAQLGNVVIEDDVEIGAGSTIDRGTFGSTVIGRGSKLDNLVQIAHNCRLGQHNIICAQVGIAGSCTTGDYVVMGGNVGVKDHTHIGHQAQLGAKSAVHRDVAAGEIVAGMPIKPAREAFAVQAALNKLPGMRREFKKLKQQVERLASQNEFTKKDAA